MLPSDIVQANVVIMLKTKNIILQCFKQFFDEYEISVYFTKLLDLRYVNQKETICRNDS